MIQLFRKRCTSIKNGLRSTKGYTYSIKRINLRKKLSSKNISLSKGGKQRIRDSGLKGVSDQEIARRARDKSLSNKERSRYKREEKARDLRNQKKERTCIIANRCKKFRI